MLGKAGAARHLIFTNFDQAVVGKRHWEDGYRAEAQAFWERSAFYNYNVTFGGARGGAPLTWEKRLDPLHARVLKEMLRTYKPTHVVVWGDDNWRAVTVADAAWEAMDDLRCGDFDEPCRAVVVDGHRSLFTRIAHPAVGFSYERWSLLLSRFLSLPA
jgi:hypothetical protein